MEFEIEFERDGSNPGFVAWVFERKRPPR